MDTTYAKPASLMLRLSGLGREKRYTCRHRTLIRMNQLIASDNENVLDLSCKLLATGVNVGYVVQFTVHEVKMGGGFDMFRDYNDLIRKITSVKNNLRICLSPRGLIEEVENKQELAKEWMRVRSELKEDAMFGKFPDEQKRALYEAGDREYLEDYPMEDELRKSPVYSTFFNEFYDHYYAFGVKELLHKIKKPSAIFTDYQADLPLHAELGEMDEECCKLNMQGNLNKQDFDIRKWQGEFREKYPFLEEELHTYRYDYDAGYELYRDNGWLKQARVSTYEKANDSFEVSIDCTIQEIAEA